jgi:glycosyltransferase involved in cell wall biosynthesis
LGAEVLKVLYIGSSRLEELPILEHLRKRGDVEFQCVQVRLRDGYVGAAMREILKYTIERPDVVLFEALGVPSLIGVVLSHILGLPFGVRIKGDFWVQFEEITMQIPLRERLVKMVNYITGLLSIAEARVVMPISKNLESVARKHGVSKTHVVNITVQDASEYVQGQDVDVPLGPFVLTVTNFNFWKKVAVLFDWFKALARWLDSQGIRWLVIGDGMFFNSFKKKIKAEGLEGAVELVGRTPAIPYYRRARALLHFSGMDGMPNVILESWRAGVPLIMNGDCPAAEFVRNDENGMLVGLDDLQDTKRIVDRTIKDHIIRKRLTKGGRDALDNRFSTENVAAQLLSALQGMTTVYKR